LDLLEELYKLSPGYLFSDPKGVHSPLYVPAAVLFAAVFLAGALALIFRHRLCGGNRLSLRLIESYGTWAGTLGATGLVVILLRYASVPLFSKRAWAVLNVLAVFALFGHLLWYRLRIYPDQIAEYREEERKRRFYPTPRGRPATVRRGRRRH
jgi:hypothetical protein